MVDTRKRQIQRAEEAAERDKLRQSRGVGFRQAEAAELIADTLVDIRDILSDIKRAITQINVKTK